MKHNILSKKIITLVLLGMAGLFSTSIHAVQSSKSSQSSSLFSSEPWHSRGTIYFDTGSRNIGGLDVFIPFAGNANNIAFLDLRSVWQTRTQEYNLGAGYRHVLNEKQLIGAYFFNDLKTAGHWFKQITLGFETLGMRWDLRGNVYIPYGKRNYSVNNGGQWSISGHKVTFNQSNDFETGMGGGDFEVGYTIPAYPKLRIYAGAFYFGFNKAAPTMAGPLNRIEWTLHPQIVLTLRNTYDQIRKEQILVGVRFNFGGPDLDKIKSSTIQSRMEDFIVRDPDVITSVVDGGVGAPKTFPENIYFVDSNAASGGDGTFEHPFQNVNDANNATLQDTSPNNYVYVYQGNGDSYMIADGQMTLDPGATWTGQGGDWIFNGINLFPGSAATAPVLAGSINLSSGNTIENINLTGQGTSQNIGIYGSGVSQITIQNVNLFGYQGSDGINSGDSGNSATGIHIENSDQITILQTSVTDIKGGNGIAGLNGTDGIMNSEDLTTVDGSDGGNGGSGGEATGIYLNNVTNAVLTQNSISNIVGGNGSNGGEGGSGGSALFVFDDGNLNVGGMGGIGGSGGDGGCANAITIDAGSASVSLNQISNIYGGNGANGNSGGDGGSANVLDGSAQNFGGNGGDGGNGGFVGSASGINSINGAVVTLLNNSVSALQSGSFGLGGLAGVGGSADDSLDPPTPGTPGSDGNNGLDGGS
ncbi:MAG: inverse autotransporter beta domain-containing protein [Proteobacteria bacterium]|nr:inverse autotransporter beta domain-containing protein [Pseudomonadota bacterium]